MEEEKKGFEAKKAEGIDVTELEANSLDEQARGYFKMMVSSTCGINPFETFQWDPPPRFLTINRLREMNQPLLSGADSVT
jgi:hypothetical protein